jgi:hypothetical protein
MILLCIEVLYGRSLINGVVMCFELLSLWGRGCRLSVLCIVGVNGRLCVLIDDMGFFQSWSFYVDMWVYVVGDDGHVSSCLGSLFFLASVVGSLVVFLFVFLC